MMINHSCHPEKPGKFRRSVSEAEIKIGRNSGSRGVETWILNQVQDDGIIKAAPAS
jgi:hypothetical protein